MEIKSCTEKKKNPKNSLKRVRSRVIFLHTTHQVDMLTKQNYLIIVKMNQIH